MIIGNVGPMAGASQIIGGASLPASPTFRQCYVTPSGFSVCLADGSWTTFASGEITGTGTSGQVAFWNGTSSLTGDSDLTFATDTLTATKVVGSTSITDSGLTAGRVTYAGAAGLLSDDSGFTYNSGTHALTATTFVGALTGNASTASAVAVGGITGLGTGVATALAVNVGSAGAFVTFNGALGSPSSAGTIPAFTLGGTIAGGGNQLNNIIIGTTTPLAGTFTTLVSGLHTVSVGNTTSAQTDLLVNPTTKTSGNLQDWQVNSVSRLSVSTAGFITQKSTLSGAGLESIALLNKSNALGVGFVLQSSDSQALLGADWRATGANIALVLSGVNSSGVLQNNITLNGNNAGATIAGVATFSTTAFVSTNLTNAAGTPGSICYNTSTFEVTKNNALTCTVSSRLFKKGIKSFTTALPILNKLRPVQFAHKDQPERQRLGFIAEELAKVDRRLADNYDPKGRALSFDQNAILSLAIEAIQELGMQNQVLNARLETLYAR